MHQALGKTHNSLLSTFNSLAATFLPPVATPTTAPRLRPDAGAILPSRSSSMHPQLASPSRGFARQTHPACGVLVCLCDAVPLVLVRLALHHLAPMVPLTPSALASRHQWTQQQLQSHQEQQQALPPRQTTAGVKSSHSGWAAAPHSQRRHQQQLPQQRQRQLVHLAAMALPAAAMAAAAVRRRWTLLSL